MTVQPPAPPPAEASGDDPTAHELNVIDETASRGAYYNAWFATGLEQTKSVFTLASAGVGLTMTLLFGMNTKPDYAWAPVWLLLSGVAFGLAAGVSVLVMRVNSELVRQLLKRADGSRENGLVLRADLFSRILFGTGLVFLLFAGVSNIWLDKEPASKPPVIK